jgi:hypothetical protein
MHGDMKLYAYFALVKLAGYIVACILLARYYQRSTSTGALAGVVRTLIGMGTGALFVYLTRTIEPDFSSGARALLAIALLVLFRFGEWGAVIWLFFGRPLKRPLFPMILVAICWSFVLDIAGFVFGIAASGMRIC